MFLFLCTQVVNMQLYYHYCKTNNIQQRKFFIKMNQSDYDIPEEEFLSQSKEDIEIDIFNGYSMDGKYHGLTQVQLFDEIIENKTKRQLKRMRYKQNKELRKINEILRNKNEILRNKNEILKSKIQSMKERISKYEK